jgi:hypothetical protein
MDTFGSSQSSWSSQPYKIQVKSEPGAQQPTYPSHGLSVPYVGHPNSMNITPFKKTPSSQNPNISLFSSSQQHPIPASQRNSMNLFSASTQPMRQIYSTVPVRVPAPFMKITELSPYVKR